jgi:2-methylcitrate dehydratase PrpD
MDAMKFLMEEEGLGPDNIKNVTLFAANNILHPIRFRIAKSELEGKFCMAFLLSSIIIAGKAGKAEFTNDFVLSDTVQAMQRRVSTQFDPEISAMGHDRIRSRIEVETKDGRSIVRWADENYRGSPHNPLSDEEVEGKFLDCAQGILSNDRAKSVFEMVWLLESQTDFTKIYDLLDWRQNRGKQQNSAA